MESHPGCRRSRALPGGSPRALRVAVSKKKGDHGGNMVSPVLELEFDGED